MKKICITILGLICLTGCNNSDKNDNKILMLDFTNKNIKDVEQFSNNNKLNLEIKYEFSDEVEENKVVNQSIEKGKEIKEKDDLIITISKGKITNEVYAENGTLFIYNDAMTSMTFFWFAIFIIILI